MVCKMGCASARTGTHAGIAIVPRTVATLAGCPVRVSRKDTTNKKHKAKCLVLFVGADYETRPVRFCAHRHARGHSNSPPDCCYPDGLPCSSLSIIVEQKKQGKKPCFLYWSGLRDSPGALLRAPARTRAPQQSPGLLLPWRVALFESLNNCRTKKARQKALLFLLERITRLELATSTLARWRSTR